MTYPYVCGGCGFAKSVTMKAMSEHWRNCLARSYQSTQKDK